MGLVDGSDGPLARRQLRGLGQRLDLLGALRYLKYVTNKDSQVHRRMRPAI